MNTLLDYFGSCCINISFRLLEKENVRSNLDASLAYKLYESHGMQDQDIIKLCNIRNIQFDLGKVNKLSYN